MRSGRRSCKALATIQCLVLVCVLIPHQLLLCTMAESSSVQAPSLLSEPGHEGDTASAETTTLEPVIVTAPRLPSPIDAVPAAVTVLEEESIQRGRQSATLAEALQGVPGMFVQNRINFAQDLRISIRGFGARSSFGIRGIQVYADGIPLTLPDGQTQLDLIDPDTLERIEVMRGPISSLYGNASGGVINLVGREGEESPFVNGRQVAGGFGMWKSLVQGGARSGQAGYFLSMSRLRIDGYRDHSRSESWKFNANIRYDLNDMSDLAFVAHSVFSPELKDPGGLTLEQVRAVPDQAGPLALRFDTGEKVLGHRLGLVYRRAMTPVQNLEAAVHYGKRDLENKIPFNFIELERDVFGGRIQYDISSRAWGISQRVFAGMDVQHQIDNRVNYDNQGGNPGDDLLLNQREQVSAFGAFLQDEIGVSQKLSVLVGGRYDSVRFEVKDHLLVDGDDTGSKIFNQITGRFGLMYRLAPGIELYANMAQSFETPTTTELVNRPGGGGGINPDIEPQRAVNYEIGLKGRVASNRLTYDAALFYIDLEDELIAFRDASDRVFYRNAGESSRIGAELSLGLEIWNGLNARLVYTFMNAEFETYIKNGVDLNGNKVPGLPQHEFYGEILYEFIGGFYAAIDVFYAGQIFVDDENTLKSGSYTLADLRAGWKKRTGKWLLTPFLGAQNILDQSYSSNVRINANGGRYFEPAPGLNIYGGISIGYRW